MALMAKATTAARAAIRRKAGFRRRTSAKTAAVAKRIPRALSHRGARAGKDLVDEVWGKEEGSGRRRRCSSRAATPMAATTTNATGLRNALRLV